MVTNTVSVSISAGAIRYCLFYFLFNLICHVVQKSLAAEPPLPFQEPIRDMVAKMQLLESSAACQAVVLVLKLNIYMA